MKIIIATALLALMLLVTPVKPTLTATPNPASVASTVAVTGCGYPSSVVVELIVLTPSALQYSYPSTDTSGCLDVGVYVAQAGDYEAEIYQPRPHGYPREVAATTFVVQ